MSTSARILLAALAILAAPVPVAAQQGPRIDVLTGEPVRPRGEHPRPEPEIFNAPHAPRQPRAADPPMEIYIAPQVGSAYPQSPYADPYADPRPDPRAEWRRPPPPRRDRRWDDGFLR